MLVVTPAERLSGWVDAAGMRDPDMYAAQPQPGGCGEAAERPAVDAEVVAERTRIELAAGMKGGRPDLDQA